jgi:hypothetical protein
MPNKTAESKKAKVPVVPSDHDMLDWLLERMAYPSKVVVSKGSDDYYCSYGADDTAGGICHGGIARAESPRAAIAKAMKLYDAQVRAAAIVREASE